jgi:hypothetical protein
MIAKEQENKSPKLSSTVKPKTFEALEKKSRETGNRSFHVNKALEIYLGLIESSEQNKIAS